MHSSIGAEPGLCDCKGAWQIAVGLYNRKGAAVSGAMFASAFMELFPADSLDCGETPS